MLCQTARLSLTMLSRSLKRVLLDSRWPLPPTFLLPWTAKLTTVAAGADATVEPPLPKPLTNKTSESGSLRSKATSSHTAPSTRDVTKASLPSPGSSPRMLSPSLREMLPLLQSQSPHYITVHIHGRPYLITQGDTIRLPFFMHDVNPGDVLRLNSAINIGSRDYTLKAPAAAPKLKSPTMDTTNIIDPTTGPNSSYSRVMPEPSVSEGSAPGTSASGAIQYAPHFIPNIAKGKHAYLDENLYVCRAVVMGVDSEPMRIKEKTKRRQRRVKKVKSKHRFTVLRVKELRVRGLEELEALANGEELDE